MSILKSKVSVIRFITEVEDNLETIINGLNAARFQEKWEAGMDSMQGFCPLNDRWGFSNFHEGNIKANGFIAFFFRIDTKRVDPNLLKREISDRIERFSETHGKKPNREERKDIQVTVKNKLLNEEKAKPSFYPVMFNPETGEGYLFATSNSVFEKFRASFKLVAGIPNVKNLEEIVESRNLDFMVDSQTFLTWFWWRMENDPTKPVTTENTSYECSMSGTVTVSSAETGEKVTEKSDQLHEARMALLRGLRAEKAAVTCCAGSGVNIEFTLNNESLNISGLPIPKSDEKPSDVFEEFEHAKIHIDEAFALIDSLMEEYIELNAVGDPLPPTPLIHWGRGDFCSGSIEIL